MAETEDTTAAETTALDFPCPVCSVPKGTECDPRIAGAALKKTHLARVRAAVGEKN